MGATDFGILFLDSALRIKRFTVRVTDLFNITPIDEGRPIADFTHQLDYDELVADARSVMNQLIPIGRVVRSRKGTWYQMRMRPYRTVEDRIEGIVVSFVDISERRQAEEALRQSEQQLRHEKRLVELSHEPIFMWDLDDGILEWNRGCEELYGYKREEALGRRKEELLATEVPGSSFEQLKAKLQASGSWTGEVRHRSKDGRELTVETRIDLMSFDGRHLVLESTHNITDRKLWEKRQRLLLGELAHRVKNTLTVVQAIAHQTLRYSPSTKEFIQRFDGRLSALARAHNLLVESDWTQADLAALARSQLEPYLSSQAGRITIAGEPVGLPAELATPFGLVLHELATNAAKHGALSRSAGTVRLEWTLRRGNREPVLTVAWKEESGSPITPSAAPGLGSSLIDNGIPGATVRREFSPTGLVCTIELLLPEETEGG
jgi:two-component system CheB/CheR fusion protein